MKTALLIGNGPNRCYEDRNSPISWSNLLEGFAKENNVNFHSDNSFPLEFECMVNEICMKTQGKYSKAVVTEAKKRIAKTVESLKRDSDPVHRYFTDLDIDEIMTTNYDYYLEETYAPDTKIKPGGTETKYSLKRCNEISGKRFYHIHGEANRPDTICLGYEHYAGTVQMMRSYVKNAKKEEHSFEYKFTEIPSFDTSTLPRNEWINLMFTHNVHIVGLKLEACEIDLWWLLTYRAYLYNMSDTARQNIRNTITFYDTAHQDEDSRKYYRSLFERMHVVYKPVNIELDSAGEMDFKSAYIKIAKEIKDSMKP